METITKIRSLPSRDATLARFGADYENCSVQLESTTGLLWTITVGAYISVTHIGHWDENIVESIQVETKGAAIRTALDSVSDRYNGPPVETGGGTRHYDGAWYLVRVKLIDGAALEVVGQRLTLLETENEASDVLGPGAGDAL